MIIKKVLLTGSLFTFLLAPNLYGAADEGSSQMTSKTMEGIDMKLSMIEKDINHLNWKIKIDSLKSSIKMLEGEIMHSLATEKKHGGVDELKATNDQKIER